MSKLKKALENGESVNGITGYVETELRTDGRGDGDSVLVKTKCLRVVAGDDESCGIKIIGTPVSGVGEFNVSLCCWYDSPEEYKKKADRDRRIKEAKSQLDTLGRGNLSTEKKDRLISYVDSLGQLDRLRTEVEEEFNVTEATSDQHLLRKVPIGKCYSLACQFVAEAFGLEAGDLQNNYRRW